MTGVSLVLVLSRQPGVPGCATPHDQRTGASGRARPSAPAPTRQSTCTLCSELLPSGACALQAARERCGAARRSRGAHWRRSARRPRRRRARAAPPPSRAPRPPGRAPRTVTGPGRARPGRRPRRGGSQAARARRRDAQPRRSRLAAGRGAAGQRPTAAAHRTHAAVSCSSRL